TRALADSRSGSSGRPQRTIDQAPLGTTPMEAPVDITAPFMSQMMFSPVALLRHRMSALPSPSKSATPAMLQFTSVAAAPAAPRPNHLTVARLLPSRARTEALSAPIQPPLPTIHQLRYGTAAIEASLEITAPFMNQMVFSPVALLRHRMSDLPFPLKSPVP